MEKIVTSGVGTANQELFVTMILGFVHKDVRITGMVPSVMVRKKPTKSFRSLNLEYLKTQKAKLDKCVDMCLFVMPRTITFLKNGGLEVYKIRFVMKKTFA